MKFVSTLEWGANESKDATADAYPINSPTKGITIHWTGTGYGGTWDHSRCASIVRGIERSHEYGNGWGDIAYNLLVCPHGYVFEGRGANVRSAANGYTTVNREWYAVCYLGGVGDKFTRAGKRGLRDAVAYLREHGNAGRLVNGHRDHKATDCPGNAIYIWLKNDGAERSRLTRGLNVDLALGNLRKARDNARVGSPRRRALRLLIEAIRDLPTWRKR